MYKPKGFAMMANAIMISALLSLSALADSQARIVRLSDVQGAVQINKNSGLGFENAFLNLPVTQGTQLRTRDNGRAEIEFEDGSTLRLTPNTTVEFSTLGLSDAGKRTSAVNLLEGRAYVNWLGKGGDVFTVNFSNEKVELTQAAHLRIATSSSAAEVANFKSAIQVVGPAGSVNLDKKKMISFDSDSDNPPVAKNVKESPYDEWDKQSVSYHDEYAKNNSTPYGYGVSDLNYYGAYSNVAGYGTLWQPYFAGASWNPFMDGAWSWYPGMGMMWASAYPWGWMPYYYGSWVNVPGFGWGWQPGGFSTWHGGVHHVGAVAGFEAPVAPKGTVSAVVVGRGGAATMTTAAASSLLVLNKGSAGLGITRASRDDLHHLNSQVAKAGFVKLQAAPQFFAISPHPSVFGLGEEAPGDAHTGASHTGGASSGGHGSAGTAGGHH
jgi:hypothetical protein